MRNNFFIFNVKLCLFIDEMCVTRVGDKLFKQLILNSKLLDKQKNCIYEIYMNFIKNEYIRIIKHTLDLELRKMVKSCK